MITNVIKRDGTIAPFHREKIVLAIFKAATSVGGSDFALSERLADEVIVKIEEDYPGVQAIEIEAIQDIVEKVLIEDGKAKTAKAFILYREKRRSSREENSLIGAVIGLFSNYLDDTDWRIKENANTQKSIGGMNNYIREKFTKYYWLNEVYSEKIRNDHNNGFMHIHDLGFFGPYCAGWDLRQLLMYGFGGFAGKNKSRAPKHLRAFLGQIVNSTFSTQGECAGAQAWSSFDTYCAPFVRYDNLSYKEVKTLIRDFVINLNVPTRVGFQCPFSNLTFDITTPPSMKKNAVIAGGMIMDDCYGDFQPEMDMINKAFCEVMLEGDADGRMYSFPIPSLNITREIEWESEVICGWMEIACKYGVPYLTNFINSDYSPEDSFSMCCHLRLDTSELKKRGGGLFGSNPLTGSIGVVTINAPRLAYMSKSKSEFFTRLWDQMQTAKESLELKRKVIEIQTEAGLYPFAKEYLKGIKEHNGTYWINHFSTIGIIGMNEACRNLLGSDVDITTDEGQAFAIETLEYMRKTIINFQEETGHLYNLEATPAEGTSYSLAEIDTTKYPDIITAGEKVPYYTNSTLLPVNYTDDIFETLELQDKLQSLYTGGTVLHLYLGEAIDDIQVAISLVKKIFTKYKLPYLTFTPTFSTCADHGYIKGEHYECPECGSDCEVWSRVVGYYRPRQNYHKGKREESRQRIDYTIKDGDLT